MDSLAEIGSTASTYQVLAKLATGGMAEIFLARSAGLGAVQRLVVLQHPNIAQVYDVGKLGDSYVFTMESVC